MRISHLISKSKPFWRIILCLKSNYELLKGAYIRWRKNGKGDRQDIAKRRLEINYDNMKCKTLKTRGEYKEEVLL